MLGYGLRSALQQIGINVSDTRLVQLIEKPVELSFPDIENTYLDVFFALGIVNPHGPTLSFVAAVGSGEIGQRLPVVNVMLNPFLQRVDQVGWYTVANKWTPRRDLSELIGLGFGDCPTMVMVNKEIPETERLNFIAEILSQFPAQVMGVEASIENFFGNPTDRVSAAMAGRLPESDGTQSVALAANKAAAYMVDPQHFWPELSALFYAWDGSINLSGIHNELKAAAFPYDRFKEFFSDYVAPSVYVPPEPESTRDLDESPASTPTEEQAESIVAKVKTLDEVRVLLRSDDWSILSKDDLYLLLQESIMLYGAQVDTTDIPYISSLYQTVLASGRSAEDMLRLENQIRIWQETYSLPPVVFIPFIAEDPSRAVAAEAAIHFVSTSPYVDEDKKNLYAVGELQTLHEMGLIKNVGAVFGALLAMGEPCLWPLLDQIRTQITEQQAEEAVFARTQLTSHEQIQYWIRWAKSLISGELKQSGRMLSYAALALSRYTTVSAKEHGVYDGRRNFPYTAATKQEFISQQKHWSFEEYAELIAPQLYELEALETAPKIFSTVLMHWGLKPAAALEDQYIPDEDGAKEIPERLRDLSGKSKSR